MSLKDATNGVVAGCVSTILTHPLDTLKIYLQCGGKNNSSARSLCSFHSFRPLRLLYRGLPVTMLSYGTFYGVYFPLYYQLKSQIGTTDDHLKLRIGVASYLAGLAGSLAANPFYVIKTRQQARFNLNANHSMGNIFSEILRQDTFLGLYRGYFATFFRNLDLAIQLPIYESMLEHNVHPLVAGTIAKLVASGCTYPIDTIRSILRNGDNDSVSGLSKRLTTEEGVRGFYRGFAFHCLRSVPASAITFALVNSLRN